MAGGPAWKGKGEVWWWGKDTLVLPQLRMLDPCLTRTLAQILRTGQVHTRFYGTKSEIIKINNG